jgi:hypothetical protein
MQPDRRATDVQLLGDHHERPELPQFHIHIMHHTHQLSEELSLDVSPCGFLLSKGRKETPCNTSRSP